MAVNLVKAEPRPDDRVGCAEAAPPPRLRCVARPELGPYHAFDERGLVAVKTGTKIIIHCAATLIRRGWGIAAVRARKARAKSAKAAPSANPTETEGGKPATAKEKGEKKPPPKARSGTADLLVGGLLVAGMGVTFVTRTLIPAAAGLVGDAASWVTKHPVSALRGTGIIVIIYVLIAWIVGGVAGPGEDRKEEERGGADEEAVETDTAGDRNEAPANEQEPADSDDEEVPTRSPEEQAERERIRVYEWVRESIKKPTGSGTAVHLRELWLSLQKEGGEGPSMADVRALLEGHEITIRDGVKAPVSHKGGATSNRPGVHIDDLPQAFTPLPTQGANLVRLLPVGQRSDLQ